MVDITIKGNIFHFDDIPETYNELNDLVSNNKPSGFGEHVIKYMDTNSKFQILSEENFSEVIQECQSFTIGKKINQNKLKMTLNKNKLKEIIKEKPKEEIKEEIKNEIKNEIIDESPKPITKETSKEEIIKEAPKEEIIKETPKQFHYEVQLSYDNIRYECNFETFKNQGFVYNITLHNIGDPLPRNVYFLIKKYSWGSEEFEIDCTLNKIEKGEKTTLKVNIQGFPFQRLGNYCLPIVLCYKNKEISNTLNLLFLLSNYIINYNVNNNNNNNIFDVNMIKNYIEERTHIISKGLLDEEIVMDIINNCRDREVALKQCLEFTGQ